jgi:UDP-N-acetylmuramate--alanine ligase
MLGELMRLKLHWHFGNSRERLPLLPCSGPSGKRQGEDPTIIVGGVVKGKGSGAKVGRGRYLIAEAMIRSEFSLDDASSAIITNIDPITLIPTGILRKLKMLLLLLPIKFLFMGSIVCLDDQCAGGAFR